MTSVAMRSLTAAALALAGAGCVNGTTDTVDPLPQSIAACETHNAEVCSTWTRTRDGYYARYEQGTEANLVVTRFDADSIIIERTDIPGAAPFTTATYRGAPTGTAVQNGTVTFRQSGVVFNGRWRADW